MVYFYSGSDSLCTTKTPFCLFSLYANTSLLSLADGGGFVFAPRLLRILWNTERQRRRLRYEQVVNESVAPESLHRSVACYLDNGDYIFPDEK